MVNYRQTDATRHRHDTTYWRKKTIFNTSIWYNTSNIHNWRRTRMLSIYPPNSTKQSHLSTQFPIKTHHLPKHIVYSVKFNQQVRPDYYVILHTNGW